MYITHSICIYVSSGRNTRESNEDISETRQQTTVVQHDHSDGNVVQGEQVVKSARYTSTKSQKTTTTVVKTSQSSRVLTNGDHTEVGEYEELECSFGLEMVETMRSNDRHFAI